MLGSYSTGVSSLTVMKKFYVDWRETAGVPPRRCIMQEFEYIIKCPLRPVGRDEPENTFWDFIIRNEKVGRGEIYMEIARIDVAVAQLYEPVPGAIEGQDLPDAYRDLFKHLVGVMLSMNQSNMIARFCTPFKEVPSKPAEGVTYANK